MIRISPLFSDGAVLCRRKEIRIFGEAENGARIHCELRDEKDGLLCQGSGITFGGRWLILLPPQETRTGCRLVISDGKETWCAMDISIGEVFLAGGQSNMEMELQNADEGTELIAEHVNPMLRYFNVPKCAWFSPEREHAWAGARWQAIEPGRGWNMSAVAYFFAMKLQQHLQVPVGVIDSYWGGTSITCWMEESWLRRTGEGARILEAYAEKTRGMTLESYLEKEKVFQETLGAWNAGVAAFKAAHPGCAWEEVVASEGECPWNPPDGPASPYRPGGLYETMIAPLSPLALTGILFYQGETDATSVNSRYDDLMICLIHRWREAFQDRELPFLFVQLPMWIAGGQPDSKTWPVLRLCQSTVRDMVRHTGMVCLLDQGEYNNLHPTNKRVVGERLFELARKEIYGEAGDVSPRVMERRVEGSMMTLQTSQPLMTRDGREPALLELAGGDGIYCPARAVLEGSLLHLTAAGVERPLRARYAWTDFGSVNLFAASGLPLEPFEI
ncbi:MAG: hypothetical protein IJ246_00865 [Clostridia bacterium]|nr:hypothetical protein [Clostridia bacterium]